MKKYQLVCQEWEESERGWGTRPDGYTLHLTEENRVKFIQEYNREHNNKNYVPDEYTRPSGDPFTLTVTKQSYDKVKKGGKNGMWGSGTRCPYRVEEKVYTGKL